MLIHFINKQKEENIKTGFDIASIGFTIITLLIILYRKETRNKLMIYFKTPYFIIHFIIIIIFSFITLSLDDSNKEIKHRKDAIKHGLLSLIISILASLDLKLVPFWLVFITSYYLNLG
tara:strand:- start:38 stop:394 length:357 start_codon:yes stop_codon:yes gene_type:complete